MVKNCEGERKMIENIKCKNCSNEMDFDAKTQNLKCSHCGSVVEISKIAIQPQKNILTPTSTIDSSNIEYIQFTCSACSRSHILPANVAPTNCPYCGSASIEKTINFVHIPDGIIPFKI